MSTLPIWHSFRHWYFEPKPFETAGDCRLYRLLGVRAFKRYLPTSGDLVSRWRGIARIQRAHGGLDQALRRSERVTRSYEARHICGALSMFTISWWSITVHDKGQWPALIAANLLINGYPILLQRYNRVRLQRALAHFAALRDRRTVGGQLTTNTLGSRIAIGADTDPPGYTQPSIATVRLWRKRAGDKR